jgi:transposase
MHQLFVIDAQARAQKLTHSDRHLLRQQKARPLLQQIKAAIEAARSHALPNRALAKGCNYTSTLWSRLTRFLDYPQLELSKNLAENAIRPVVLERKNWIHIGSKEAGELQRSCRSLTAAAGSTSQFVTIGLRFCRAWPTAQLTKPQS